MSLRALDPYLPTPLVSLKTIVFEKGELSQFKYELINTVLAASGCFLAMKYAGKSGLNLAQLAAVATVINPAVAKLAIGGYLTWNGTKEAFAMYKVGDFANFAKASALALLGYFTNTKKYQKYDEEVFGVGLGAYVAVFKGKQVSNVAQIGAIGVLLNGYVAKKAISTYLVFMAGTMILEARTTRNVDSALKAIAVLVTVGFANTETYSNLWNKYIYYR